MPLFRRIHCNPGDDSTYLFEINPNPKQYESVPEKAAKKAASKPDEVVEPETPAAAPAKQDPEAGMAASSSQS